MQFNGNRKTLKKNRRNCPIPKIFAIRIPVDVWNFCAKFRKNLSLGLEVVTVFEGRTDRQTDRHTHKSLLLCTVNQKSIRTPVFQIQINTYIS